MSAPDLKMKWFGVTRRVLLLIALLPAVSLPAATYNAATNHPRRFYRAEEQ